MSRMKKGGPSKKSNGGEELVKSNARGPSPEASYSVRTKLVEESQTTVQNQVVRTRGNRSIGIAMDRRTPN